MNLLLLVTLAATGHQAFLRTDLWYGEKLNAHLRDSTLVTVRAREKKYSRINEAYAGSLEDLKIALPSAVRSSLSIAAGPFNGKPDFLAEYCLSNVCRSIDAEGHIRASVEVEGAHGPDKPALTEGPGRYFKFQPRAGK